MSTYFPYFRGKQFELITVRDCAPLLQQSSFVPIIEPVQKSLGGLNRTLEAIVDAGGKAVVITNPEFGAFASNATELESWLRGALAGVPNISMGVRLHELSTVDATLQDAERFAAWPLTLIHAGFTEGRTLAAGLSDNSQEIHHVFIERDCGKLYRKHFVGPTRILIRDGFEQRTNRSHPDVEHFSDLHATYSEEGMSGFGDFLMVGDNFSVSGGPAYTVAIHTTYVDSEKDDEMFIQHFKSDSSDTPTDPAGKFSEALAKLVREVRRGDSPILRTKAIDEFLDLAHRRHFPGLGYVKKLSMNHHIEAISNYFQSRM